MKMEYVPCQTTYQIDETKRIEITLNKENELHLSLLDRKRPASCFALTPTMAQEVGKALVQLADYADFNNDE